MQLCLRCGLSNADDVGRCSCGCELPESVARIHQQARRPDDRRLRELQLASRTDLRNGAAVIVILALLAITIAAVFQMRPGLPLWGLLFSAVILLIRGFRLRREARQLEHVGFIEPERDQPVDVEGRGARPQDTDAQESEFGFIHFLGVIGALLLFHSYISDVKWVGVVGAISVLPILWKKGSRRADL
jgi:hypothetical protein